MKGSQSKMTATEKKSAKAERKRIKMDEEKLKSITKVLATPLSAEEEAAPVESDKLIFDFDASNSSFWTFIRNIDFSKCPMTLVVHILALRRALDKSKKIFDQAYVEAFDEFLSMVRLRNGRIDKKVYQGSSSKGYAKDKGIDEMCLEFPSPIIDVIDALDQVLETLNNSGYIDSSFNFETFVGILRRASPDDLSTSQMGEATEHLGGILTQTVHGSQVIPHHDVPTIATMTVKKNFRDFLDAIRVLFLSGGKCLPQLWMTTDICKTQLFLELVAEGIFDGNKEDFLMEVCDPKKFIKLGDSLVKAWGSSGAIRTDSDENS
jgi:hypothetical protein